MLVYVHSLLSLKGPVNLHWVTYNYNKGHKIMDFNYFTSHYFLWSYLTKSSC